jgi:hypothetical protein
MTEKERVLSTLEDVAAAFDEAAADSLIPSQCSGGAQERQARSKANRVSAATIRRAMVTLYPDYSPR